ncbi:MAG: hypothetical protein PWQ82_168 [Thermosediminibacterales bacterium]|nr:hypothetical protein [Thermosediminibacterales bacterium]MDK2835333.1 hypothetical protein [Thermosediminibacterales bacterium]
MKLKVGFICVGNSCRSQMAEGFARFYGKDVIEPYSAGTHPALEINPNAVAVMKEKGIDLSFQYPKLLEEIPSELDILITMGCNVQCPYVPCKLREDWGLEDPVGKPIEQFRETRDVIEEKVKTLIEKIRNNELKL